MIKTGILCSSDAWGGLEINILNLAKWLTERGHQISIFCRDGSTISNKAKEAGVATHHYVCKGKHFKFGAARRLARLLDKAQIPTLLIGHYEHFYIGIMSKSYSKQPLKAVYLQQMQMKHRKRDLYHRYFYKRLDAWIVPLDLLKKQLLQNTGIAEQKVHVIPLTIEVDRFADAMKHREESRKAFKIPPNAFVAGIIGRIDKEKGQEYLIKAVEILEHQDLHIYGLCIGAETVGGEKGHLRYLEKMAVERHLMDLIHFRPFVEDAPKAFAALDVFVMASRSEPFGMVTVEAMASGLPVIGTDAGGTTELLDYGKAGILIPPENEQAMAEALKKIYHDNQLREQLIEIGRKRAKENYSHTTQCAKIEALFERL
ncbi:glycosyltransferase family 4 protein [uncultured Microscilla sp.]|uniref:glycosyltransferase family 4 protein n=1 Tax=uncultured Microscilla sp. TaxID=432653 RepID=UPI00262BA9EC|nr:glycosyltransferase family 4 protein [uncultured Microscilla sp.]